MKSLLLALLIVFNSVAYAQGVRSPSSLSGVGRSCLDALRTLVTKPAPKSLSKIASTWGMEIELFPLTDLSRAELANRMATFFHSRGFESRVYSENAPNKGEFDYFIELKRGNETKVWGLPYEPSLYRGINYKNNGIEITTAIMETPEDEEILEDVLTYLIFQGLTKASNIGGTHIHLGTNQLSIGELYRIFSAFEGSYDQIRRIFNPDEGRRYISQAALMMGKRHLQSRQNQSELLEHMTSNSHLFFNEGPIRFNKKYNTLELRFFNSSLDFEQQKFNLAFAKRFIPKILADDEFYENLHILSAESILKKLDLPTEIAD